MLLEIVGDADAGDAGADDGHVEMFSHATLASVPYTRTPNSASNPLQTSSNSARLAAPVRTMPVP